jgi:hypothetical protein
VCYPGHGLLPFGKRLFSDPLADKTYAQLLERLTTTPQSAISGDLKQRILDFYGGLPKTDQATIAHLIVIKETKTKENDH